MPTGGAPWLNSNRERFKLTLKSCSMFFVGGEKKLELIDGAGSWRKLEKNVDARLTAFCVFF